RPRGVPSRHPHAPPRTIGRRTLEDPIVAVDRKSQIPPGKRPAKGPGRGYGVKRALPGPPLPTAQLIHERLGKSTALAIFSSDALSSVAYATEEMLRTLFIAGVLASAAFSLLMP